MANPFAALAAGYATARPAVHPLVMERVRRRIAAVDRAVDVGCGAGLSTRPLVGMARHAIGMEPAEPMLAWAREVAPGADFVVGGAESLPFAGESVDLITAAGSLNYADPEPFFGEARRVLRPGGVVVVYDFSTGRSLRESPQLDEWFERFVERYPWPPNEARTINPDVLREVAAGFVVSSEDFEVGVRLEFDSYVEYVMTETNVAFAIRKGAVREDVRAWCVDTLGPVFGGAAREVLFRGYIAYLENAR